ncbi:MAG: DUF3108 domain-containing protein [Candidatus Omnitrophica bacterium]|nr:DUF3108 domain-containing protein [Candidatus Omnitrophota bacterium]MDD5654757.1 DUF3108 domain-containing protein [Candidatus Omnitrophota bacterium]
MKIAWSLPFIFLLISSTACAQNFKGEPKQEIVSSAPRKELKAGETLVYNMRWMALYVGKIVFKVEGLEDVSGRPCYHIIARAFPNNLFKKLYDVEYTVDSYIDTRSFDSLRFIRTRRINKEYERVTIDFDRRKNEAVYKIEPDKTSVEAVAPGTQDLLSLFYYFRFRDIQGKSEYSLDIYYDQKSWPVEIKTGEPYFKGMGEEGVWPVVKVFLDSNLNKYIFGKRRLIVLATLDSRRIPLRFELPAVVGSIAARLQGLPEED